MEKCKTKNLYNLDETIAKKLLEQVEYPWEALPKISEFIIEIGKTLDNEIYECKGENIWIAKNYNMFIFNFHYFFTIFLLYYVE